MCSWWGFAKFCVFKVLSLLLLHPGNKDQQKEASKGCWPESWLSQGLALSFVFGRDSESGRGVWGGLPSEKRGLRVPDGAGRPAQSRGGGCPR